MITFPNSCQTKHLLCLYYAITGKFLSVFQVYKRIMSHGDLIGIHLRTSDTGAVQQVVAAAFAAEGFFPASTNAASCKESYEVVVTETAEGWVSVLVDDWPDSGVLAQGLSARLGTAALELWVSGNVHWGYTLYERGVVIDRFADDPRLVGETQTEQALYQGRPEALAPLLRVPAARAAVALEQARHSAGQFAAGPVDAFVECLGLPLEQAFLSIDDFLDGDPEDLPPFHLLSFQPPLGRQSLVGDTAVPR